MKKLLFLFLGLAFLAVPAHATLPGDPGAASGNGITPQWLEGNPKIDDYCPSCDWYNLKIEPVDSGTYGSFTIAVNDLLFEWSSTSPIHAVLAKGGPNASLYEYGDSGSYGDTLLHAPINPKNEKYYGLSHISYCAASPVPEPCTMLLLGTGLVGFAGTRIRKRFKK